MINGGAYNRASGVGSTVGGYSNIASGAYSAVGGGNSNFATNSYTCVPGGYGGNAINYGQFAFAGNFFSAQGDGQYVQQVLYADAYNGNTVALTPEKSNVDPSLYGSTSILNDSETEMVAMYTIQVLGFDDSDNFSQAMRKVVIRKRATNTWHEEIVHIESIGTDVTDAGGISFFINTNSSPYHTFAISGGSNSDDNTRWLANVQGLWLYKPPAYP